MRRQMVTTMYDNIENDLRGKLVQVSGSLSYRGFELPRVKLQ